MLAELNCSNVQSELANCQNRSMKVRHRLEIKNNAMCYVNEESSVNATAVTPPKNKVLHALAIIWRGLQIEGADLNSFLCFLRKINARYNLASN